MVVGTTRHQVHAPIHQALSQSLGVGHHLLLIHLKLRLQSLTQSDRFGSDDVHQRTALGAGEDGRVDLLGQILIIGQDHTASRSPQGLVGGGGHHMRIRHRRGVQPCGHQAGNVSHIHPQISSYLIGNGTEPGKINGSGIGRGASHNHLGLALTGHPLQLVIVNIPSLLVHAVGHNIVVFTREIHRTAMSQMSAVIQIHTQNRVPGLAQSHIHCIVGLSSRVGLHIGEFGPIELTGTLNGQGFHHVHTLTAAIIALAGVPFRVLIGQHAASCSQHRLRDDIFRSNQLNVITLSLILCLNGCTHFRVHLGYKIHIFQNHGRSTFPFRLSCSYYIRFTSIQQ